MSDQKIYVTKRNGSLEQFDEAKILRAVNWACDNLAVNPQSILNNFKLLLRPKIKTSDIQKALIIATTDLISISCMDASYTAARLQLLDLYKTVRINLGVDDGDSHNMQYPSLRHYIETAILKANLSTDLLGFDLEELEKHIQPEKDLNFQYLGLTTLINQYLIKIQGTKDIIELPQHFLMRVAMGVALAEKPEERNKYAIEFYNQYKDLAFLSSTPTLFNSGTTHSQMSSCYVNHMSDSLSDDYADGGETRHKSIMGTIDEAARFSKYAGGIGINVTAVRSAGSHIKSTNGTSSGVIPYIKVLNDTLLAVNQGGKRKGSAAVYLEPWHADFLDFCDLRKEAGDQRLRAHDIFPAAWIPDLFFKRLKEKDGVWSFFSPIDAPGLVNAHTEEFERLYLEYEEAGVYKFQKSAMDVFRTMLESIFTTGHPWWTFKDTANRRNPQQHCGMIRSSNLCVEIMLNTSEEESAVCNLGSLNLARHVKNGKIDWDKLKQTIRIAVRMLDNVIDINFYPSYRAKNSNLRHRPIGLGVMGYYDMLVKLGVRYVSEENYKLTNELFEFICYHAIDASSDLAEEKGYYRSFNGSLWSKGILTPDTAKSSVYTFTGKLDWDALREKVKLNGMRNCNLIALAPTATIANIAGTTQSINLPFDVVYNKQNLNGAFTYIEEAARYLPVSEIETAYEVNQEVAIQLTAIRQRWIDQSQSLNLYLPADLTKLYGEAKPARILGGFCVKAWELGLKSVYYLRTQSKKEAQELMNNLQSLQEQQTTAQQVEQNTENFDDALKSLDDLEIDTSKACSIDNPNCESCQ